MLGTFNRGDEKFPGNDQTQPKSTAYATCGSININVTVQKKN